MAISLSYFPILSGLALLSTASAATVTYNFNLTWVTANPNNQLDRATIGINGQWPLPIITATVGDNVIVNVDNQLGNQTSSLHFHGLFMNGTNHMDGPTSVTQCSIPPGSQFTYNFNITQPGTYWYHSHDKGQYPDGLRAPLIITDPDSPYKDDYDEEYVMSVSDWYNDEMANVIPKFIYKGNPTGAEPIPDAALLNDTQNLTVAIQPGKTYLFRVVNIGAFAGQYLWFEGHNMTIVEVDGVYVDPAVADRIYISAAQRYSFLITARNETNANYAFTASMDTDLFDTIPATLNWNVTGWLVYDDSLDLPPAAEVDTLDYFDDFTLVPVDKAPLLQNPSQQVVLDVIMDNLGNGKPYAFFNNITYVAQKVPTLYTVMTTGENATDPTVYGEFSHSFVLDHNEVIEIVVNNMDTGKHPFHLHGHHFQVIDRSDDNAGAYDPTNSSETEYPAIPMRRDTIVLHPAGYMVLRFVSNNPGVWLFHCHIEWHMDQGLVATMIEAPLEIQSSLVIPEDHFDACRANNQLYAGNAAGNTVDVLDLSGANKAPGPLPVGFTAKGIVAMTFCVLAAIIGTAVIVWYGMADMGAASREAEKRRIAKMDQTSN